jgi:hypothetical protein
VCETDKTYVLESRKGRKIPENYYRKHAAVTVRRVTPSKEEILEVSAAGSMRTL